MPALGVMAAAADGPQLVLAPCPASPRFSACDDSLCCSSHGVPGLLQAALVTASESDLWHGILHPGWPLHACRRAASAWQVHAPSGRRSACTRRMRPSSAARASSLPSTPCMHTLVLFTAGQGSLRAQVSSSAAGQESAKGCAPQRGLLVHRDGPLCAGTGGPGAPQRPVTAWWSMHPLICLLLT